ncbi:hypothetical protein ACGFY0_25835 [Streptomyces chartreusis]|uniref:hypothetical protein n=1 Tax=Streptomyces chartreusis TaxID=1969 RepID=UPI00371AF985
MEIRLRDKGAGDISKWSMTTLAIELRENFIPSPQALSLKGRAELCRHICAEIDRRGLSADELVRYGLGNQFVHTIPIAITAPGLMAADKSFARRNGIADDQPLPEVPAGWLQLADLVAADTEATGLPPLADSPSPRVLARRRMNAALTNAFTDKLHGWLSIADLDSLIGWEAPSVSDFLDLSLPESSGLRKAAFARNLWLMDRLTETYLSDWRFPSLKLEWRYGRNEQEAPCSRKIMRERRIDRDDLARALSDAASGRDEVNEQSEALYSMAFRLVKSGQLASATELLKLAQRNDPENPNLLNSLGFCLLAEELTTALGYLERARALGYKHTVNICNMLYGLYRLGKYAAVLELAEATLANWKDLDRAYAVLWDFKSAEPKILRRACPRCYVRDVGLHTVRQHGDERIRLRWREIARTLNEPSA